MYIGTYVYMYICIYVYMYICIYVYMYIYLILNFRAGPSTLWALWAVCIWFSALKHRTVEQNTRIARSRTPKTPYCRTKSKSRRKRCTVEQNTRIRCSGCLCARTRCSCSLGAIKIRSETLLGLPRSRRLRSKTLLKLDRNRRPPSKTLLELARSHPPRSKTLLGPPMSRRLRSKNR